MSDSTTAGQSILQYTTQLSSNPALSYEDPQTAAGHLNETTGVLTIGAVTFTPANATLALNKMSFYSETSPKLPSLGGSLTNDTETILFDQELTLPAVNNVAGNWARFGS